MAEAIALKETRFYMRNVRTRMPFRYGAATLVSVPILHVGVTAELGGQHPGARLGGRHPAAEVVRQGSGQGVRRRTSPT